MSLLIALLSLNILAAGVCKKCEVVREYNKEHPGEYEFYEDYLKDQEQQMPSEEKKKDNGET